MVITNTITKKNTMTMDAPIPANILQSWYHAFSGVDTYVSDESPASSSLDDVSGVFFTSTALRESGSYRGPPIQFVSYLKLVCCLDGPN